MNVIIFIYFFLNQKSKLQILDIFTAVFHQSSARPVFGKIVARIRDKGYMVEFGVEHYTFETPDVMNEVNEQRLAKMDQSN